MKIKTLQRDKITADEVEIESALGSEIYARKIKIKNLFSNNKLFASEEIVICNVKGENNLLEVTSKGKIIAYSSWKYFNKISFDLPFVKIVYDTKDDGVCGFKLKDMKIVKIKVNNDLCT